MPSGGGPVRVRCVGAGGRDAVFEWGGCVFGLGTGTRICGGSAWKKDTSIPVSLSSSSSTCMHMVVSARDIGLSHSVSVSVRSDASCIGVSSSSDVGSCRVLALRTVDAREGSGGAEAGLGSRFKVWLGSEVGVDFPDRIFRRRPRLAVFAKARPRGSG